jgi:hypothetical protein
MFVHKVRRVRHSKEDVEHPDRRDDELGLKSTVELSRRSNRKVMKDTNHDE